MKEKQTCSNRKWWCMDLCVRIIYCIYIYELKLLLYINLKVVNFIYMLYTIYICARIERKQDEVLFTIKYYN